MDEVASLLAVGQKYWLRVSSNRIYELKKSPFKLKKELLGLTILSPKRQAFPALHELSPTELDSKLIEV
jgi:hypothetical protein